MCVGGGGGSVCVDVCVCVQACGRVSGVVVKERKPGRVPACVGKTGQ